MYAIWDVPSKGKGLIAIEKISRGTRILSEEPIITLPESETNAKRLQKSIAQQVDALSDSQRQAFLSMHNIHPYKNVTEQYLGIIRTNALPIEADGFGGGIFLEACRINHACDNNAQKNWNENIKRHTIHALREIDEGEEITIYYLGSNKSRKARNEALEERFGFTCSCRLCSLPSEKSEESDKRLSEISRFESLLNQGGLQGILSSPMQSLRYVNQQVILYNEQGPGDAGLSRAFFDAAQIAIANGDLARGRVFADRAVSEWQASGGSDCTSVLQHSNLPLDPSKLSLYGMSMKWKTAVDDVPSGLEPKDFENWLWKRETNISLSNRAIFPGFADLPSTNTLDAYNQAKHWCFLGEIVDSIDGIHHLELEVEDVDGKKLPVHFNTEERGREFSSAQVRKGYTVAVLDAKHHVFIYGAPGIKHQNPQMMRVRLPQHFLMYLMSFKPTNRIADLPNISA
jgi:hypothetical protein